MPDTVGVLNLEIKDNSEQAGQGLDKLADALTRVKTSVGKGLGLSTLSRSLNTFTSAVNGAKGLSSVGTFLNAVAGYAKAFKDLNGVKLNTQPIEDLKAAIGEGIKIGQAGTQINNIRTALEGKWNTENAYNAGIAPSSARQPFGAHPPQASPRSSAASKPPRSTPVCPPDTIFNSSLFIRHLFFCLNYTIDSYRAKTLYHPLRRLL